MQIAPIADIEVIRENKETLYLLEISFMYGACKHPAYGLSNVVCLTTKVACCEDNDAYIKPHQMPVYMETLWPRELANIAAKLTHYKRLEINEQFGKGWSKLPIDAYNYLMEELNAIRINTTRIR